MVTEEDAAVNSAGLVDFDYCDDSSVVSYIAAYCCL